MFIMLFVFSQVKMRSSGAKRIGWVAKRCRHDGFAPLSLSFERLRSYPDMPAGIAWISC